MGAPVILFVYDITHLVEPMVIDEGNGRPPAPLQSAAVQGFWVDPTGHDLASVFEPVDAMEDGWPAIRTLAIWKRRSPRDCVQARLLCGQDVPSSSKHRSSRLPC